MNRTRAFRRAQRDRRRAQAARTLAASWTYSWATMTDDEREFQIQRHVDCRTVCSCYMCGNPRKYENKRTRAEVIADLNMRDGIDAA